MQREFIEKNPVLKLSFEFSLLVMDFCEVFNEKKKFVISQQLSTLARQHISTSAH